MLVEEQVRGWRILYVVGFLWVLLKVEVVIRWYAHVAQFLCLHMVIVGVLFRRLGSLAVSVCGVGVMLSRWRIMSMNCPSVGCSLARTRLFCTVGCRREMKRGDVKCRFL